MRNLLVLYRLTRWEAMCAGGHDCDACIRYGYPCQRPALPARRLMFEPFGGVRTAMEAAATGLPPDALLDMQDWEGALNCADPEYEKPCVRDLEAILIAFDVLYCDEQARRGGLAWRARGERGHAPRASQLAGVAQPQVLCTGLSAVLNRQGGLLKCLRAWRQVPVSVLKRLLGAGDRQPISISRYARVRVWLGSMLMLLAAPTSVLQRWPPKRARLAATAPRTPARRSHHGL